MPSRQIPLSLPHRPGLDRADFLVGAANAAAIALIDRWPQWPSRPILLAGPVAAWLVLSVSYRFSAADELSPGEVVRRLSSGTTLEDALRDLGTAVVAVGVVPMLLWWWPRPTPRARVLLGLGFGYLLVVPYLGYTHAIVGLLLATAIYAGARFGLKTADSAGAGGLFFYLLFVQFLHIPLPPGLWPGLLRSLQG